MPEIVSCPDCGRKLRVPDDLLGKRVKCPGCQQKFLAETAVDVPEARDEGRGSSIAPTPSARRRDEAPQSRRRDDEQYYEDDDERGGRRDDDAGPRVSKADKRQGWERVRFGVNLLIVSCWILIGTMVAAITGGTLLILFGAFSFATIFSGFGSGPVNQQQVSNAAGQAAGTGCAMMVGAIVIYGLIFLLLLAYEACRITGLGFFMAIAPTRKTQYLKVLAIIVFCIAVAAVVLPPLYVALQFALIQARLGGCVMFGGYGLSGTLGLAEFVCFFLFLRGVAVAMRDDKLAQNIVIYMISVPVYFVIWVIAWFAFVLLAGAALFGAAASSAGSHNPSAAAGNLAGAGAALFIGGITCQGVMFMVGVALFIWFMVMLYQLRGALDRWLDRN